MSYGKLKTSAQYRLHLWGQSYYFYTSTISSWFLNIPCSMVPDLSVGFYIPLFFFIPFIMIVGWMVHVNSIKFPFHPVFGLPIPILAIYGNITLLFIESTGFNIVKSLNKTLFGSPSFFVDAGLGSVTSSSLNFFKNISLVLL